MRKLLRLTALLACLITVSVLATGCTDSSPTEPLAIRATGTVAGLAFIDRDGNKVLDPSVDGPLAGLRVALLLPSTSDTVARAVSAADGSYIMLQVPVGSYQLAVDTMSAGDSLSVTSAIRTSLLVESSDTIVSTVAATYPTKTVVEARRAPAGRRVFVSGLAVTSWSTFGDSTLHIVSGTAAIRATRVRPTTAASGDSVRLLARTGVRDGQPVLVDGDVTVLGSSSLPIPLKTTTALAATALAGTMDAGTVRVENAAILTTTVVGGDLLLAVNDGSGRLEVLLDGSAPLVAGPYVPGALISATGVLVPGASANLWRLKPRSEHDLSVDFPRATVAQARGLAAGKRIAVDGVALNGWATFADGSIHFGDATGALRAFYAGPVGIYAADSVRFVGTLAFRDGEPALINLSPVVLGAAAALPEPRPVTTAVAATADHGRLDAALVRITNATVVDTASVAAGIQLTVDDSSGLLHVLLDPVAGFTRGLYAPGKVLDLVGLLAPRDFGGTWQLKPRGKSDVTVK